MDQLDVFHPAPWSDMSTYIAISLTFLMRSSNILMNTKTWRRRLASLAFSLPFVLFRASARAAAYGPRASFIHLDAWDGRRLGSVQEVRLSVFTHQRGPFSPSPWRHWQTLHVISQERGQRGRTQFCRVLRAEVDHGH